VGHYIKHACQGEDVDVDLILPHEISVERFGKNDLNFLLIYDLLEAFHTDKTEDKKVYAALKQCLSDCENIYPPLDYQELIYSKIKYYNFLKENEVDILPTLTMTTEEYHELGHDEAVKKVLGQVSSGSWGRFICKPVYGQESKDAKFFQPTHKKLLANYFSRCMKKYPGIVVQKAVEGFGSELKSPELRMYYMGDKYKYSVCWCKKAILTPQSEGGRLDAPMDVLRKTTREILDKLPKMVMPNGAVLPRLTTRLDMGYMIDGKVQPFVNEVEFVPSLYCEDVKKEFVDSFIREQGLQMVKITRLYAKSRQTASPPLSRSLASPTKKAAPCSPKSSTKTRRPTSPRKAPSPQTKRALLRIRRQTGVTA